MVSLSESFLNPLKTIAAPVFFVSNAIRFKLASGIENETNTSKSAFSAAFTSKSLFLSLNAWATCRGSTGASKSVP